MPRTRNPEKLIATAHRDRRIVELRRLSWHWVDIAAEVGLSMARCHQIWTEHLGDIPQSEAAQHRAEQLGQLTRGTKNMLAIAENEDESARTRVEAQKEARFHGESLRRMLGLDAPVKRELEILDSAFGDARLAAEVYELECEQRAADALRDTHDS